jgi:pyruvate,water dikinase
MQSSLAVDHSAPNALHAVSTPAATWSSINLAEAVPGVMTPLCASLWVPASELGLRRPFLAMGALPTRLAEIPADPADRITNAFYGRMAVRVDFLCQMGDLIPGQSGEALSRDFFGFVPDDFCSRPSVRRLPFIMVRYPRTLATIGRRIKRLRSETDAWWRAETGRMADLEFVEAQRIAATARDRFFDALATQAVISATVIQPLQEQLASVCERAGVDAAVLLRGSSHEEGAVLDDLWATSRGVLDVEQFVERHGYHGPGEGELETRVWREDPAAVHALVQRYRAKPDAESPHAHAGAHRRERQRAERTLLHTSGPLGRLRSRGVLALARRCIPLRGTGKVSYLQCLDVLRAAARHLGGLMVASGRLTEADDALYLTIDELTGGIASDPAVDLKDVVAERRRLRSRYQAITLATAWTGQPEPLMPTGTTEERTPRTLSGVGACAGVVEGRAVVIDDPAEADVDDGDILIARTTDPSWVSLMFLSSALVVDIGGFMSHAAVVARELDIPCVMNTGSGTSVLRTGDRIRVDGAAGTVELLDRGTGPTTATERTSP